MRLLGPLRRDRGPPGGGAAPPAGRAAGRQADRARQLHADRRRRGGNPGLDGPADGGAGDRRPLGSHCRLRPTSIASPRPSTTACRACRCRSRRAISICTTRSIGRTPQRLNLAGGHRFRARPATDLPAAIHAAGAGGALDLALPHRRLAPQSHRVEVPGEGRRALRRGDLLDARLRAAAGLPDVPDPAFDRSPLGQELRDSRERSGWRRLPAWASTRSGRCCCRSRGSIASRTRWA